MNYVVTAWSYSRLADFELCPARFQYKYLDKFEEPGSDAMNRGNRVHKEAENFILSRDRRAVVPRSLRYVSRELVFLRDAGAAAEQEWGFQSDWSWTGREGWFGEDVWLRAKADAVVVYDDDTALVGDWKTGKKYGVNEDQIELMAMTTFHRFPNIKEVDARLWYTDISGDNEVRRMFYEDEIDKTLKKWNRRVKPMFEARSFPPRVNEKCGWCHYRKANGGPCKY